MVSSQKQRSRNSVRCMHLHIHSIPHRKTRHSVRNVRTTESQEATRLQRSLEPDPGVPVLCLNDGLMLVVIIAFLLQYSLLALFIR
ncbi:hypothetical protein VTI28DRAFT_1929 [Corynascus sepedonium]